LTIEPLASEATSIVTSERGAGGKWKTRTAIKAKEAHMA
jgi:hypothetical protein